MGMPRWRGKDCLPPETMSKLPGSALCCKTEALGGRDWAGTRRGHSRMKTYVSRASQSGWHWPGCCLGNWTCFLQSHLDYSSSSNLEMPLSQESSSAASVAPSSQDPPLDCHRGDTFDVTRCGKDSCRVDSPPPAPCQHPELQDGLWPPSAPWLATEGLKGPVPLVGPKGLGPHKTQVPKSILSQPSKPSKVTQECPKIRESFLSLGFPL